MPLRPMPLWVLTVLLLISAPVINITYWWQVLTSGVLSPDKDAVAIPMFAGILVTLIVAPFILGVTWFCLRRYNSRSKLFAWRADRPLRSLFATIIFGGAAGALALALIYDLRDMFSNYPWYEFLYTALLPPSIAWLLTMRAALIEQAGSAATAQPDRALL